MDTDVAADLLLTCPTAARRPNSRRTIALDRGWLKTIPRDDRADNDALSDFGRPPYREKIAHIGLTSGTTSLRKKVGVTRRQIANRVDNIASRYKRYGPAKYLSLAVPHLIGPYTKVLSVWQLGGTVIFSNRRDPAAALVHHRPDETLAPTNFYAHVLKAIPKDHKPRPDLRLRVGGVRLSAELHSALAARLSPNIECSYGTTETGTVA
jgi:2,3-dihydroxybenzoate-AMP ligase